MPRDAVFLAVPPQEGAGRTRLPTAPQCAAPRYPEDYEHHVRIQFSSFQSLSHV